MNKLIIRSLDLIIAILLSPIAFSLIIPSLIVVFIYDRNNPLYTQIRIGLNGAPFKIFKIRTMVLNNDSEQLNNGYKSGQVLQELSSKFKINNDSRILPIIGEILRKTSIDELPQLLNVIAGDMSLVGPRPLPRYHYEAFSDAFKQKRNSIKPGLTGEWQVNSRHDSSIEAMQKYDSILIDSMPRISTYFFILYRTFFIVIFRHGAK